VNDLKAMVLATTIARSHPILTEQKIMTLGGERYELRRRALSEFRVGDTAESLNIRCALAGQVQSAEKVWRSRMIKILEQGHIIGNCLLYVSRKVNFL